jgi:hypothetical protein
MDWLTFTVEIVKALAWPVAAVTIVCRFHEQIRALLGRVKKGKLGPAEFEFEEAVQELKAETESKSDMPSSKDRTQENEEGKASDARSIVLESWLLVEAVVERLGKKHQVYKESLPTNLGYVVRELRKLGVLDTSQEQRYMGLRSLRNQAAHTLDFTPTPESVLIYLRLARDLELQLRKVAGEV